MTKKIGSQPTKLRRAGLRIEILTICILSRPNLIVNFGPIWKPTTISNFQLWFWSSFDLFLIKKIDKSQSKDWKIWLKDRNRQLKDWKCQLISKKSIDIEKFDHFRLIFNLFPYKLTFSIWSEHNLIDFVVPIDLDSKNLDQNFD